MLNAIEINDERMAAIVRPNASLQRLANNAVWSEGPVYFAEDNSVVWSDAWLTDKTEKLRSCSGQ